MFTKCKRGMTVLLAAVMLLTTMLPLTASAASGVTMDLTDCHVSWDYTLTDEEGNTFSAAYGLKAADDIYFGKGFSPYLSKMHDYTAKRKGLTGSKADWEYGRDYVYCFCIERGIPLPDNTQYSASENPNHGNKYALLTENQKDLLRLALTYGYPNRVGLQTSKDANACYAATQLIVWQITMGFRSSATALNDKTYPMSGYSGTMTEQYTRNKYLKAYYDGILSDMATHYTRPSFTAYTASAAKTFEMDYSGGRYTVTLTDTNRVLQNYAVTVSGGASVSINGNTLTVSSVKPMNDEVTVKLNRRVPSTDMSTGFLIWSVPGKENANQDMVSGVPADNDPVPSYLKVRTAAGSAKIVKVSEDGKTITVTIKHMPANSGFSFNINGILTGETLENSPVLAPIVLHNWLTGTDSECTVPTEEPTTPAPSDSPTPEPTTPAPAPSATPSGKLARTGADTPMLAGAAIMAGLAGLGAVALRRRQH